MRIVCAEQHTAEWYQARCGIVTGSRIADAMRRLSRASKNGVKGDWHGDHWTYVRELAWEQITRVPTDHYVTKPMEIGAQYEGEARIEFWMRIGAEIEQTGFVLHPTIDWIGASPDGYIVENGVPIPVELKVPQLKTHEKYIEDDCVPEIYIPQVQCEMLCCDRAPYAYFASYAPPEVYPELPDEFRLFYKRIDADAALQAEMEEAAQITMEHVVEKVQLLQKMYPSKGAPKSKFVRQLEESTIAEEVADTSDFTGSAYDFIDQIEVRP